MMISISPFFPKDQMPSASNKYNYSFRPCAVLAIIGLSTASLGTNLHCKMYSGQQLHRLHHHNCIIPSLKRRCGLHFSPAITESRTTALAALLKWRLNAQIQFYRIPDMLVNRDGTGVSIFSPLILDLSLRTNPVLKTLKLDYSLQLVFLVWVNMCLSWVWLH